MSGEVKLTGDQLAILQRMKAEPGEGAMTAEWIAEGCGHYYDTPWASSRLPGLIKRGLVEIMSKGWYRITPSGLAVLQGGGK